MYLTATGFHCLPICIAWDILSDYCQVHLGSRLEYTSPLPSPGFILFTIDECNPGQICVRTMSKIMSHSH